LIAERRACNSSNCFVKLGILITVAALGTPHVFFFTNILIMLYQNY
jgi:hypothetical protein